MTAQGLHLGAQGQRKAPWLWKRPDISLAITWQSLGNRVAILWQSVRFCGNRPFWPYPARQKARVFETSADCNSRPSAFFIILKSEQAMRELRRRVPKLHTPILHASTKAAQVFLEFYRAPLHDIRRLLDSGNVSPSFRILPGPAA